MDPKLLQAARSGDKSILDELLGPEEVSSTASMEAVSIRVPEDAATQTDTRVLLGVTPEGNTALHIVASLGHLELADKICQREISLLAATNTLFNTPLHCAAKAGNDMMVSLLIRFAGEDGTEARRVLRARNRDGSNALHEAAKYAHARVAEVLMEKDSGLASMLNDAGMSPLYLAIVTGSFDVAEVLLRHPSTEMASPTFYAGPDDRTALHEAVLLDPEITKKILQQNPMLAKGVDSSKRIPIHYVASEGHHGVLKLLLEKDPSTAYVQDAEGLFPIHIAARMGNVHTADQILRECPDTDELLDMEGKNFLHAAFENKNLDMVKKIISERPQLRKLLNEQDKKGNTPLHTVVKNKDLKSVRFLLRDKGIHLNIMNRDGLTPLDLAYSYVDKGLFFITKPRFCILSCLALTKALFGPRQWYDLKRVDSASDRGQEISLGDDKVDSASDGGQEISPGDRAQERSSRVDSVNYGDKEISPSHEIKKRSSSRQNQEIEKELKLCKNMVIPMVLIATVTFAAGFTLPGGIIADDHPSHSTAVLSKKYAFRVFVISDAFALFCSMLSTRWLISVGSSTVDKRTRWRILGAASFCLEQAFVGILVAFAMGIYVVLAPSCKIISVILCCFALGSPLLAEVVIFYNFYSLLGTIGARLGYRSCVYPATDRLVEKRLSTAFGRFEPGVFLMAAMFRIFGTYALFFLMALIKK